MSSLGYALAERDRACFDVIFLFGSQTRRRRNDVAAKRAKKRSVEQSASARSPVRPEAKAVARDATVFVLYDLVCDVEGVLETELGFSIAEDKARDHNEANAGHDAAPVRRQ
jgi:hypothetical protein